MSLSADSVPRWELLWTITAAKGFATLPQITLLQGIALVAVGRAHHDTVAPPNSGLRKKACNKSAPACAL